MPVAGIYMRRIIEILRHKYEAGLGHERSAEPTVSSTESPASTGFAWRLSPGTGAAADLADRHTVAVYPVGG